VTDVFALPDAAWRYVRNRVARAVRPVRGRARARRRVAMTQQLTRVPARERCPVCDAPGDWSWRPVVGALLAFQWRLTSRQRAIVDVQQGHSCGSCGLNLRARGLARAILDVAGARAPLASGLASKPGLRVLEINPAGGLTPYLAAASLHVCTSYPAVDMQQLPFPDASFDMVVHSDTLEHVPDAVQGMRECLRVAGGGQVVFTTPVLPERRSKRRGRRALRSYHGGDGGRSVVFHEFGADIWRLLVAAGAVDVRLHLEDFPYVVTISCRGHLRPEGETTA
jgi:2-polyprenyl-3-methyl-5-hydroxy-6-metoxy-1,4-benzoquinol methylase